jgi:hypothetical protein
MGKNSNGKLAESAALHVFRTFGWSMYRSQQSFKTIRTLERGQYIVVFTGGELPDYTGHDKNGNYVCCECKEATGETMPCSRLADQHGFMETAPMAHVLILWTDVGRVTLHHYKRKGSYKIGESII